MGLQMLTKCLIFGLLTHLGSPAIAQIDFEFPYDRDEIELDGVTLRLSLDATPRITSEKCGFYSDKPVTRVDFFATEENVLIQAVLSPGSLSPELYVPRDRYGKSLGRRFRFVEWILTNHNRFSEADPSLSVFICPYPSKATLTGKAAFDLAILYSGAIDIENEEVANFFLDTERPGSEARYGRLTSGRLVSSEEIHSPLLYARFFSRNAESLYSRDPSSLDIAIRQDAPGADEIAPPYINTPGLISSMRDGLIKEIKDLQAESVELSTAATEFRNLNSSLESDNIRLNALVSQANQRIAQLEAQLRNPAPPSAGSQTGIPNISLGGRQGNPMCGGRGPRDQHDVYLSNMSPFPVRAMLAEVTRGVGGFASNPVYFNEQVRQLPEVILAANERDRFIGCRGFVNRNGDISETNYRILSSTAN